MIIKVTARILKYLLCVLVLCVFSSEISAQKKDDYKSLLWKISGNGLVHESYLFGTMHAKEKAVFNFSENFNKAFNRAETFAMEIALDSDMYTGIFNMMMADENYNIHNYLSDAEYAKLDNWLKKEYGFKLKMFEKIKPIFLYVMTNKASVGMRNEPFLDEYLAKEAETKGKQVVGLETIEEQVAALDNISLEEQFKMILQSIEHQKKEEKAYEKLLQTYKKQDLDKMMKLIQESSISEVSYKKLIDDRNITMTQRMLPLLKEKSTFVAVGAGHLPGEMGIINLLRKQSFIVEAVK
jgi:uncharacterized protein YbaP (TraB family)